MSLQPELRDEISFSVMEFSRKVLGYAEANFEDGESGSIVAFNKNPGVSHWSTGLIVSIDRDTGLVYASMRTFKGLTIYGAVDHIIHTVDSLGKPMDDLILSIFGRNLSPENEDEIIRDLFVDEDELPYYPSINTDADVFTVSLCLFPSEEFTLGIGKAASSEVCYSFDGVMPNPIDPNGVVNIEDSLVIKDVYESMIRVIESFDRVSRGSAENRTLMLINN